MKKRTDKRKHFLFCHIAGFTYWDGCFIFRKLEIGTELRLVRELENEHDSKAVAIYYDSHKLGYIPSDSNKTISILMDMGYSNIFDTRISSIDKDSHPERQIHISIFIKRANYGKDLA